MYPRGSEDALARLDKGKFVTVRCRIEGKLLNVIGRDCELR
jgi:hypothetical protein